MANLKKKDLQTLYERFSSESAQFGFKHPINDMNDQLVPLLLADKIEEAINLVVEKRFDFWLKYAKMSIKELENILKPKTIFEDKILDEVREIKRKYTLAEKKCKEKDLTAIDDFEQILENVNRIKERAESSRSKSATNFLFKSIQWGILVSFASLTAIFYFVQPIFYLVPIPFAIMMSVAIGGYILVKKYPYVATKNLSHWLNILMLILGMITSIASILLGILLRP